MAEQNIGKVVQVVGPVLDIRFENGHLPALLNAVHVDNAGETVVCEVAQQLGDDTVRCIAMSSTDGLQRGTPALDTGASISVPVGDECLGRVFNLLGEPVDNLPAPEDAERYQCIFAKNEGAVVMPAAGANFSRELMKRLEIRGAEFTYVTLHASLGMFREIDVEDLTKHKADSEQMEVTAEASQVFNAASARESKICAVGTTTLRALETASTANGEIKPFEGWTNRFIFPPYQFTTANCLISNFQLPYSMMLMNQASFGGYEQVMNAYDIALKIEQTAGYYECQKCGHKYIPTFNSVMWAMHFGRTRYMKCPECNKRSWQKKVLKKG